MSFKGEVLIRVIGILAVVVLAGVAAIPAVPVLLIAAGILVLATKASGIEKYD